MRAHRGHSQHGDEPLVVVLWFVVVLWHLSLWLNPSLPPSSDPRLSKQAALERAPPQAPQPRLPHHNTDHTNDVEHMLLVFDSLMALIPLLPPLLSTESRQTERPAAALVPSKIEPTRRAQATTAHHSRPQPYSPSPPRPPSPKRKKPHSCSTISSSSISSTSSASSSSSSSSQRRVVAPPLPTSRRLYSPPPPQPRLATATTAAT